MHNPESVLENETHKFWDFEIKNGLSNHGQTTRPYNNQQKRQNLQNCGLCCPGEPQYKIERKSNEG